MFPAMFFPQSHGFKKILSRSERGFRDVAMRKLVCLLATSALVTLPTLAEDSKLDGAKKIGTAEAGKHYQETCIVTGKVAQVSIREKLVYLNLDKPYPGTPFTGVIFAGATNQFGDLSKLKGKDVEIKGRVEDYKGKVQIVLTSTNQLKVVDQKAD
jgi:DNA/RNA endonuclease YhcR with UshA esterase domain